MGTDSQEIRLREVEMRCALLDQRLEEAITSDEDFKQQILEDLHYLIERDIKVSSFIDSHLEKDKASAEFWTEMRAKIASAGVWGVIVLFCTVAWYAFNQWIKNGGN